MERIRRVFAEARIAFALDYYQDRFGLTREEAMQWLPKPAEETPR